MQKWMWITTGLGCTLLFLIAGCERALDVNEHVPALQNVWAIHQERAGGWTLYTPRKPKDVTHVELAADRMRSVRGHMDPARIQLRCEGENLHVEMIWAYGIVPKQENKKGPVFNVQFDNNDILEQAWLSPHAGQVAFHALDDAAFIQSMVQADSLEIDAPVATFGRTIAVFNLEGTKTVVDMMAKFCSDTLQK